jgi:hypothetical protein
MQNLIRKVLFALCFCLLWVSVQAATRGPVIVNVDVPSGQWKVARLRNLPKETVVAVKVECEGDILVAVVNSQNYLIYPKVPRPLFLGQVVKRLSFSVTIPESDDYFVVLDNRSGAKTKTVTLTVAAARSSADQVEAADKILHTFEKQLHQLFIFDPFSMGVERCNKPKAFLDRSGVSLCAEYVYYLYDTLGDKQKAQNALAFSIFHEVAQELLAEWHHPAASRTQTADQFTTVLMVMLKQSERASSLAEYIVSNPSASESLSRVLNDNRHPPSPQRAKNILRWLEDPHELARKWQKILVPHMQTKLLKRLLLKPTKWTNLDLVEKELRTRQKATPKNI